MLWYYVCGSNFTSKFIVRRDLKPNFSYKRYQSISLNYKNSEKHFILGYKPLLLLLVWRDENDVSQKFIIIHFSWSKRKNSDINSISFWFCLVSFHFSTESRTLKALNNHKSILNPRNVDVNPRNVDVKWEC